MMEEIFESRRHMDIPRPNIKEQVFMKMTTGIATPSFLKDLRVECKKIDKYLQEH